MPHFLVLDAVENGLQLSVVRPLRVGTRGRADRRQSFEEEARFHIEERGEAVKRAGAQPVFAKLVFADLLIGKIDGLPCILQRGTAPVAQHSQTRSDMRIDRVL